MKYLLAAALLTFFFLSACQPANLSSSEGDQEPATTSMPDGEESLNIQLRSRPGHHCQRGGSTGLRVLCCRPS
jgi:hypothetical protein